MWYFSNNDHVVIHYPNGFKHVEKPATFQPHLPQFVICSAILFLPDPVPALDQAQNVQQQLSKIKVNIAIYQKGLNIRLQIVLSSLYISITSMNAPSNRRQPFGKMPPSDKGCLLLNAAS